jgi:2-methylcitrate dehydratase PrpD
MATYAEQLADFVCRLRLADVPEDVRRLVRLSTMDNIGVILAGQRTESAHLAVDWVRSWKGRPESTILGYKDKVPAHGAAFANGVADHSIELDDHIAHTRSLNHPGVTTFPVAFALAEKLGASGEQLMLSAIAGYEVTSRIDATTTTPGLFTFQRGFHSSGICGPYGAAATAASLLGLNPEQLTNAFGICGSTSAGSFEFNATGSWTKRFHAGWAGQAGITAAELARRGYTGPATIFEGRYGFFRSYAGEGNFNLESLTRNLGRDFEFRYIMYKPFSCAGMIHSPLTATLRLLREHDVEPDQIEGVIVKTSENLIRQFTTPTELKTRPKTSVDAQFSLPYSVAALLTFKRALTDEYSEKAIRNPKVLDLAARVQCMSDPELTRRWPKEEPSEVTLRLKDGTEYKAAVSHAKGSLGDPMTDDELKDKFRFLAGGVLKETAVERIIDIVADLENLANVKSLIRVISNGSRGRMSRLNI